MTLINFGFLIGNRLRVPLRRIFEIGSGFYLDSYPMSDDPGRNKQMNTSIRRCGWLGSLWRVGTSEEPDHDLPAQRSRQLEPRGQLEHTGKVQKPKQKKLLKPFSIALLTYYEIAVSHQGPRHCHQHVPETEQRVVATFTTSDKIRQEFFNNNKDFPATPWPRHQHPPDALSRLVWGPVISQISISIIKPRNR